ncbi:MAG: class D sortase [Gemmatimonadetes bacterium]|nr:class D sortase [Gemmatimonadota bacterium]
MARLRIPRIGLDDVVLEGISKEKLAVAPGHYPRMPLPGDGGHAVLSAHRDSFFKRVGRLAGGDRISVLRPDGREILYEVARSYIVHKSNRTVIVPREEEVLTLVTCYPFVYAGAAPYRYIVEALPAAPISRPD